MPESEPLIDVSGEPLSDMIESGPVRRWPGFMLTAVTLGAGVLLVVGVPEPRPDPGPAPRPSPTVPSVRAAPISISHPPVALDLPGEVRAVDIGSTGYTAAISSVDCPPPNPCDSALAVSEDRQRWQRRQLPDAVRQRDPVPLVLDDGVILVESRGGRWHSLDGGRTWRRVRDTPAPEAASTGAGRLHIDVPGRLSIEVGCFGVLSAIVPDTGRSAPLRQQPALMPCHATPFPDAAGRLWVGGIEPSPHVPAVAMSPDRGRRWQVWRLTGMKGQVASVRIHQVGSEVYAVAAAVEGNFTGYAIFRYGTDSWTLVRHTTGHEPEQLKIQAVCPGGLLLGGWPRRWDRPDQDRLLFSPDNGRGWYLARGMSGLQVLTVSYFGRSAWLGWYGGRVRRPVFSEDCRHWEGLSIR